MGRPDRAAQLLARRVLEQVARGARLERGHDVGVRVVRREHEHARRIAELRQPPDRGRAVDAGHAQVHQHHVGPARLGERDRFVAVRRLPDHVVQRIAGEHAAQPVAHDRVVVDDQEADRRRVGRGHVDDPPGLRPDRRQTRGDRRPAARLGLDRERARQPAEPLAHRREAEAGSRARTAGAASPPAGTSNPTPSSRTSSVTTSPM